MSDSVMEALSRDDHIYNNGATGWICPRLTYFSYFADASERELLEQRESWWERRLPARREISRDAVRDFLTSRQRAHNEALVTGTTSPSPAKLMDVRLNACRLVMEGDALEWLEEEDEFYAPPDKHNALIPRFMFADLKNRRFSSLERTGDSRMYTIAISTSLIYTAVVLVYRPGPRVCMETLLSMRSFVP